MQITRPTRRPRTPTTQTTKRPRWVVGGTTILTFVALLYLVELIDQLSGSRLDVNGIRPLKTDGLWGVIFAPLLHANWHHLMANTIPLLVLGFLMTLAGLSRFVWATGDHLDSGRLGHLADRQCGQQLWPDRPYRRLWPDLWLAGLPIGVRAFCAQGMGYRHWAGGLVCLWRHPARRDAGAGPVWWRVMAGSFKWCGCWRRGGVSVVRSGA